MKKGDKAKVSPKLTGASEWIDGEVIDIEKNPFMGIKISWGEFSSDRKNIFRMYDVLTQIPFRRIMPGYHLQK
jgi:hypothetical protein